MLHLAEVRWQQGARANAVALMLNSLEIMESQVGPGVDRDRWQVQQCREVCPGPRRVWPGEAA